MLNYWNIFTGFSENSSFSVLGKFCDAQTRCLEDNDETLKHPNYESLKWFWNKNNCEQEIEQGFRHFQEYRVCSKFCLNIYQLIALLLKSESNPSLCILKSVMKLFPAHREAFPFEQEFSPKLWKDFSKYLPGSNFAFFFVLSAFT